MKPGLLALHRWLGFLSGLFLLLIGLSGSILVYYTPLERLLNPAIYHIGHIEPHGTRLPLDSAYSTIYKKFGNDFSSLSLDMPAAADEVFEFTLTKRQENFHTRDFYLVDLDPYSGSILREGYCEKISTSFMHWVMYFHDSFHFGKIGMLIVVIASIAIFSSIITGVFIYGTRIFDVLMFRVRLRGKGGFQWYRSLHLYVGVWTLLFNIVVSFTGFWMMRETLNPGSWKPEAQSQPMHLSISIDRSLQESKERMKGFEPDYLSIPLTEGDVLEIDGNMAGSPALVRGDANRIMFDPHSGNVLKIQNMTTASFPEKLTAAFWPLHTGRYGGEAIRILYVIGGLTPGLLFLTGILLWWKRKRMLSAIRNR